MDKLIKLDASVVSHRGKLYEQNENNYYMDGRFLQDHELDNVQVTIDRSSSEYIFAVSDRLDVEVQDKNSSISAVKELKKFSEKMKNVDKDFEYKFGEFSKNIEEVNNIIYSALLGDDAERVKKPSFAMLFMNGNRAAVLNIGECRVCLYRGGMLKQLSTDNKKAERLLKMGIITDEQAEILSERFASTTDGKCDGVKKTDIFNLRVGDIFILTSGLSGWIEDDRLSEIISLKKNSEYIANSLIREALANGADNNITVLALKVSCVDGEEKLEVPPAKISKRYPDVHISHNRNRISASKQALRRKRLIKKYASLVATFIVVFGVILGIVKLWNFISNNAHIPEDTSPIVSDGSNLPDDDYINEDENNEETGLPEDYKETGNDEGETSSVEENTQQVTHKVKEGDNLYQISMRYYNDPQKMKLIQDANGIENANEIYVGQLLVIPEVSQ